MVGLEGKTACLSRNGRGGIGSILRESLIKSGVTILDDGESPEAVDFAICTAGKMFVRDPGTLAEDEVNQLYDANYFFPRMFTERHIQAMRIAKKPGIILHVGSNASRYGNLGAADYAAMKAGFAKYLELRGQSVRGDGIRLSLINLGAVDSEFWGKVCQSADPALLKTIMPAPEKALTLEEVSDMLLAVLQMPTRLVLKDALVVSADFQ